MEASHHFSFGTIKLKKHNINIIFFVLTMLNKITNICVNSLLK